MNMEDAYYLLRPVDYATLLFLGLLMRDSKDDQVRKMGEETLNQMGEIRKNHPLRFYGTHLNSIIKNTSEYMREEFPEMAQEMDDQEFESYIDDQMEWGDE